MTDFESLIVRRPSNGRGVPIRRPFAFDESALDSLDGVDEGWRLAVEIVVPPEDAALWGAATWGTGKWTKTGWRDVTADVRQISIELPGTQDARAVSDVGDVIVVLSNNTGRYSVASPTPFASPPFMGAGTLLRVSVFRNLGPGGTITDTEDWYVLGTCLSTSWREFGEGANAGQYAVRWTVIAGEEPMSRLGRVDELALTSPVGSGDTPTQRVQRLLDAAEFPFNLVSTTARTTPLQSTVMAGNRAAELQLVADTIDADLVGLTNGRVALRDKGALAQAIGTKPLVISADRRGYVSADDATHVDYDANSLETTNDDEMLINRVTLNYVGGAGTQYTASDPISMERKLVASYTRADLIYQAAQHATAAPYIADRMLARGAASYRPLGCTIDAGKSAAHMEAAATLARGNRVTVRTADATFTDATIAGVTHTIAPLAWGVHWLTDVDFGVATTFAWETND